MPPKLSILQFPAAPKRHSGILPDPPSPANQAGRQRIANVDDVPGPAEIRLMQSSGMIARRLMNGEPLIAIAKNTELRVNAVGRIIAKELRELKKAA